MNPDDVKNPIPPQDEQTPAPEYGYNEIHETPIVDIPTDTPPTPESHKEEPKEEVKPEEPDIDPVKIAEDAARKVVEEQEARAKEAEAQRIRETF